MSLWKNKTFRTKLFILFFLLSSIPSLLIGTTAYNRSSEMLISKTENDLEVILAQLNTSIERQINDFDRFSVLPYYMPDLFSFLNEPYVSKDEWGTSEIMAQKTMVRLMSAYPSINSSINGLMLYGMNGTVNGYRASLESSINLQEKVQDQEWYKEVVRQEGGFVVTGLQTIKQFSGTPFEAIIGSRLLMDDNHKPLAVIAIFISPNFMNKLVTSLQLPHVQVTVLDNNQKVVYTTNSNLAQKIQGFSNTNLKKGVWVSTIHEDHRETTYRGVSLRSDYLGWKIYMGVINDEILKGSRSIRNFTIVIVVMLAFASASVSWLLARELSKPISRLIRSMRDVERGNFSVPTPAVREDEIGQLEKSYGKMVNKLDELIHSIEENERQKRHAELYALRARIQPHFLYNTLNSIRMLAILQQSPQIAKLIQSLNKLLHSNMKLESEVVSLHEEINLLKDYAALMDLRYTNVFNIEWEIAEETLDSICPPMLLQPLLENAIFHGAKGLERRLNITLQATLIDNGETVLIRVTDDGGCFPADILQRFHDQLSPNRCDSIGLQNVRDRIRLRFGENYGLSIRSTEEKTQVVVRMPYRKLEHGGESYVESANSRR